MRQRMCTEGMRLYMVWTNLLEQTRPKADKREIRRAKKAFVDHYYKICTECGMVYDE